MSNLQEIVGYEYEPYSFKVEEGKIKELAAAIGDKNPIYQDLSAAQNEGFERIPIPLTFLQVIDNWGGYTFQEKIKVMNLNPVRILHGEQYYEILDEIYAGDTITVQLKIAKAITKKGSTGDMDIITYEHRYHNQNDQLVAIAYHTIIHRH